MRKLYSRSCAMVVESLEERAFLAVTPFVDGKLGTGVSFDRAPIPLQQAPAIDMGDPADNHLDITGNFTIETWVKFNSLPQEGEGFAFVSKDVGPGITNKWIFGYANNEAAPNKTFFHITNADGGGVWAVSSEWTPQVNVWYHLAVTKTVTPTNSVYRFFKNGSQNSITVEQTYTGNKSIALPDVNEKFLLGRAEYVPPIPDDPETNEDEFEPRHGFWLHGALDDIRVWNIQRSGTQINASYKNELVGNETGLVGYWKLNEGSGTTVADSTSNATTGTLIDFPEYQVDEYHSKPDAAAKLFINFGGDYLPTWGGEDPFVIDPYDSDDDLTFFNPDEKQAMLDIWQVVADAFSPFNIDVTTANPSEINVGTAVKIDVGGDGLWFSANSGGETVAQGVAPVNGFTSADGEDHIGFAFAYTLFIDPDTGDTIRMPLPARALGLVVAHEAGHTFGLRHQSVYAPDGKLTEEYHPGFPDKGPIMGAPYGSNRFLWWNGTSTSRLTIQDDISILAGSLNAFGYRADEFGDTIALATPITLTPSSENIPTYDGIGVITKTSDVDVLKFSAPKGPVSIKLFSAFLAGANANMLDADIELRDGSGNVLGSTVEGLTPSLDVQVPNAGTYYLFIKSHGIYGDIGQYNVQITTAAGPVATGAINGTVFNDANSDGAKQAGETGMAAQTVFLDTDGDGLLDAGESSTTTAADGSYSFSGLIAGTYKVRALTPSGYTRTTALADTAVTNIAVNGVLVGFHLNPTAVISGTVFNDASGDGAKQAGENGMTSQTVFLDTDGDGLLDAGEKSTTTAADGSYSFSALEPGSYKVRVVVPSGYTQTTAAANPTLASGQSLTGILIGLKTTTTGGGGGGGGSTGSLSGVTYNDNNKNGVYDSGDSIASGKTVFIDLDGDNTLDTNETKLVTDGNGKYTFTGLAAGAYKVRRVFPTGYTLSGSPIDVNLTAGQALTGLNIGSKQGTSTGGGGGGGGTGSTGSISGFLFFDTNKNSIFDSGDVIQGGKTVFIDTNGDGKLSTGEKSTTTNAQGNYSFTGLTAGTYKVRRVLPTGYKVTTPARNVTLTAGQNLTGVTIGTAYV